MKKEIKKTHYLMITAGLSFLAFSLFFYLLFIFLPFKEALYKQCKLTKHITTIVHASFSFLAALLILLKKIKEITWEYLLAIIRGYIFFTMFLNLFMLTIAVKAQYLQIIFMLGHHIAFLILSFDKKYALFFKQGLLCEITMPFLKVMLLIKMLAPQYIHTPFFYLLIVLTLLLYFIFRVCNFTLILYKGILCYAKEVKDDLASPKAMALYFSLCLFSVITLLNYYWFFKIVKGACRLFSR